MPKTPPTKTKRPKKGLPTGITELTREKHRYDGFVIRAQRGRYAFRKYISSAALHNRRASDTVRRNHALHLATDDNKALHEILADTSIWNRKGLLTKSALHEIKKMNFSVKEKYK